MATSKRRRPYIDGHGNPGTAKITPTPETVEGLLSTDITTGLLKTTILVSLSGSIVQTISMADLSAWLVTGSKLTLYSQDNKQIILTFKTANDAKDAELRIADMLNGGTY